MENEVYLPVAGFQVLLMNGTDCFQGHLQVGDKRIGEHGGAVFFAPSTGSGQAWDQTMQQHPHVHFIVTGGALVNTPGGYRWQAAKRKYLFPVKMLSKDFLRAFCAGVRQMWQEGRLDTANGELDTSASLSASVAAMLAEANRVGAAQGKDWEVYIQAPLYGVEKLLDYLARYIFRIAIPKEVLSVIIATWPWSEAR